MTQKRRPSSRLTSPLQTEAQRVAGLLRKAREWESHARARFLEDLRFRHGDSDNNAQWPMGIRNRRGRLGKPCLTFNLTRQHNLQVINGGKLNRTSMRVIPTGNGASAEAAICFDQLVHRIEFQSNAQSVFDLARAFQVDAGWGYWRLVTEYLPGDTFDQEIFIRGIPDPLMVYMDPKAILNHGGDGNFAFVEDWVKRDEFSDQYPDWKERLPGEPALGALTPEWGDVEDEIQVCEFFERIPKFLDVFSIRDPETGMRKTVREDMMPKEVVRELRKDKNIRTRRVKDWDVKWKLFVGSEVVDETDFPIAYIPIIRCSGERAIVDGVMDCKSHTRALKDPQRMFNYNASAQVEQVALQSKTPWLSPAAAIGRYDKMWAAANVEDYPVLMYDHKDEDGDPINPPLRTPPPTSSMAFQEGMDTAFKQMMMTSGQWQNDLGMPGSERTGDAIEDRQQKGDVATHHFRSSFEEAQAWTTKLIVELIPFIYDTRRVLQVEGTDGTEVLLELDPAARQIFLEDHQADGMAARRVLNPQMGRFDVRPAVGAAYGTKREQTVKAMTLLLTQAPALSGVIGDLMLRSMDFPEAMEASQRLRRMVPPQALGQGPSQMESALQQQLQQSQALVAKTMQEFAKLQLKLEGRSQMRDIDAYKAETDRIKALGEQMAVDPEVIRQIVEQLGQETSGTTLAPLVQSINSEMTPAGQQQLAGPSAPSGEPPHPNAQQGTDGEWYLSDPTRKGRFLRLEPLATLHRPPGIGGGQV